jgi:hypothetical protein
MAVDGNYKCDPKLLLAFSSAKEWGIGDIGVKFKI